MNNHGTWLLPGSLQTNMTVLQDQHFSLLYLIATWKSLNLLSTCIKPLPMSWLGMIASDSAGSFVFCIKLSLQKSLYVSPEDATRS